MKIPADIELGGRNFRFTEETTTVCGYPATPDYDHIELEEPATFGETQKVLIWNAGRLACYLSGMVIGNEIYEEPEGEQLSTTFYQEYGWNAKVVLKAHVEPHIIEKYIGRMTRYLVDIPTVPHPEDL